MIRPRRGVATVLAAAVASAVTATNACACTLVDAWPPVLSRSYAFFMGVATMDTIRAGRGAVELSSGGGHVGATGTGDIYGQIVTVTRPGGAAPRSATQAVLVPWDYGASCRPVQWGSSARWLGPGMSGLFRATLRDSTHWARGIPTYDVHYTLPEPYRGNGGSGPVGGGVRMSPEAAFDLLARLVVTDERSTAAYTPLMTWASANPEVAKQWPAYWMIMFAGIKLDEIELRKIRSPFYGVYRASVTIPGDTARVFYLRTETDWIGEWSPAGASTPRGDPFNTPKYRGYSLLVDGTDGPTLVPQDNRRQSYINLPIEPTRRRGTVGDYEGEIETTLLTRQFLAPADSAWRALVGAADYVKTVFSLSGDGTVKATGTLRLPDGRPLTVTLDRISLLTNK